MISLEIVYMKVLNYNIIALLIEKILIDYLD
nr:MAG TPA: hypothetical protein [Caudoviricetes sp.]